MNISSFFLNTMRYYFFSVKCIDRNCQANALCSNNKCTCKFGFVDISGICEGRKTVMQTIYKNVHRLLDQQLVNISNLISFILII